LGIRKGQGKGSKKMIVRAWTSYVKEEETELSLYEGDIIDVIDNSDDDW